MELMETLTVDDVELVAAVNDFRILEQCLKSSPDVRDGRVTLTLIQGETRPGKAFNDVLDASASRLIVIVHQDVYLPASFVPRLLDEINRLAEVDPDWGVIGCIGADEDGVVHGKIWASSVQAEVGNKCTSPTRVESLDEVLLVLQGGTAVRFDEGLPSFHLYATDLVQSAKQAGRSSYVVPIQVVHHSKRLADLGGGYRTAYRYCQRKWAHVLPVPTLFGGLRRGMAHLLVADLRIRRANGWRRARPEPVGNPAQIARDLGYEAP
ncbi:glycosyltransferase [Nocardioides sp. Soil805]|uniref:glycosyltransferase n=1 Tax=Nocardioides sp. Soil805 TaxID=1736416 RepID=UPI000703A7A3|nr:glycosyltransferase [Nocardioides sp. Soil805]KRF35049.1 hypothetical protein ASG94_13030 [Nocardioides sp. Soil805]